MLTFERIDIGSFQWGEIINNYPHRTIYQTPAWLSFVARTQNAEPVIAALKDGRQTVGYFTGLIVCKFGFRLLGSPFPGWTTFYMGLCLSPGISRRMAIEALVRFAFEDLRCIHLEIMDRNLTVNELSNLNFEYKIQQSFEIDLTKNEEKLFSNMAKSCQRCIRKAEKNGIIIEEANDLDFADDYYAQLVDVFSKQSLVPTYGVERVRTLINYIHPTGMILLLRARDPEGHCIATGIFPATNQTMYFWGGASWRKYQILRPNEAIQWYAMRYWKERGMQLYDMGGGGKYKKKYGGYEIFVPWFHKSKYHSIRHVRNIAQRFVKIYQQLLGRWRTI
jgi:hypothetical protein